MKLTEDFGKIEDIEKLLDIEKESFLDPWNYKAFENQIKEEKTGIITSKVKDKIVSYVCYYFIIDTVHIVKVAVAEEYRKKGIGSSIIQSLIKKLSLSGAKEFVLEVRSSNLAGRRLYESLGFQILGERKNYYSDGESGIMMSLLLSDKGE